MKKFIYISGIILINLLLAGVILKMNHWPGAGILLTLSIALMVLMFFPVALLTSYKQQNNQSQLHLYIIAYLTIAIQSLGMLFKIQHWPGASILLFVGLPIPFILFLPFYLRFHNKTKAKSDKNFFGIIFFMIYLAIISSLLSLDASKEVYDAFKVQTEELVSQSNALEQKSNQYYADLIQNPERKSEIESFERLNTSADNLYKILEDAKKEIILKADESNNIYISNGIIDYNSLYGLSKKNISISYINQQEENRIETKLVGFEHAIKNLSDKYELNNVINPKDAPYSLAVIKNNIKEVQFSSKSMVENLSALSFMQNRVRLIEYQILTICTQK